LRFKGFFQAAGNVKKNIEVAVLLATTTAGDGLFWKRRSHTGCGRNMFDV
jgi:hypothetical protein